MGICVSMWVYAAIDWNQERASHPLKLKLLVVRFSDTPPYVYWKLDLDHLEEQKTLLIVEPSFQFPTPF